MMNIDSNTDFQEGQIMLFDKALYWTSFDLVKKVKNIIRNAFDYKKIKVGHAGTLDPLASGLMLICTGKYTKKIASLQVADKEYVASFHMGKTTPSFDLETEIDKDYPYQHITKESVEDALKTFTGEQDQVPPVYSAKNIKGKRAYEYARKGVEIEMEPKKVWFHELELLDFSLPEIKVRIKCSKGTYIRSFARDLGFALKSGSYLSGLKRTKIGTYNLEDAIGVEEFEIILKQT